MTDLLINLFIKNNDNINDKNVRESYGILASIVGITCNLILFITKLIIGFLLNSVAVMADSINNLSDCGSSLFTIIGFKMGNKPADNEHPFGHGRMEYLGALGVSLLIMIMGLEFFKTSVVKIFNKEPLLFSIASITVLLLTVLVKFWLHFFNKKIGKKIDSNALKILAIDARNDACITLVTIFTLVIYNFTGLNIDGYAGAFVAVILIKNGFDIAKDTFSPLLGESTDPELAKVLKQKIQSYNGVVGTHDLIVHNYGPKRSMATIHVEVDNKQDIDISHNLVDNIERDIREHMDIFLLIHMDPIDLDNPRIKYLSQIVLGVLKDYNNLSAHDFRIIEGRENTNFIFDLEVPHGFNKDQEKKVYNNIKTCIAKEDSTLKCIINVESGYVFKI